MKRQASYNDHFGTFSSDLLYQSLDPELQASIRDTGFRHFLTYQELRQITVIATDLNMWGEPSLTEQVQQLENELGLNGKQ